MGWIALDTLTTTRTGVTVGDLYTRGEAAVLPIGSGDSERMVFLSNLQRIGYFDRLKVALWNDGMHTSLEGLRMPGLLAHFRGRHDEADCHVTNTQGPCLDILSADNELYFGDDPRRWQDDTYGPAPAKPQLTPWTRPSINGCTSSSDPYCQGLELTWAAIDAIRYVPLDPDSTMAFDYYQDFRTAPVTHIRADSWMGPETDGSTFTGEVRVTNGATLTIEPGTELAFHGGLTVEPGAHIVFHPGSVARFAEGVVFTIEGGADIQGAPSAPVVFEGDGLFPYQRWGGLVVKSRDTSLSYAEVSGAGIGIEVRGENVTLDHLTLSGNGDGLVTDYCGIQVCFDVWSTFELTNSTITGNEGEGLTLRNTRASGDGLRANTITGNGGHGVVVWNADIEPFEFNLVEGNGVGFPYAPNVKYDGIAVLSGGDLRLSASGPGGYYGYNRIADNFDGRALGCQRGIPLRRELRQRVQRHRKGRGVERPVGGRVGRERE